MPKPLDEKTPEQLLKITTTNIANYWEDIEEQTGNPLNINAIPDVKLEAQPPVGSQPEIKRNWLEKYTTLPGFELEGYEVDLGTSPKVKLKDRKIK